MAYARIMSESKGTIVFQGGGAFTAHDDLDRRLLKDGKAKKVVVLPTADAFERPEVLVTAAMSWGSTCQTESPDRRTATPCSASMATVISM